MPSKKKARSQARKAKKEEAKQQATGSFEIGGGSTNTGGSSCTHIKLPDGRTLNDFKEACELYEDYNTKFGSYFERLIETNIGNGGEIDYRMLLDKSNSIAFELAREPEFQVLDDASKEYFDRGYG
jgi:hypothetical protein